MHQLVGAYQFPDKSLGRESRLLPDAAFAVEPMMVPPPINDLSFYDKSLVGEIRLLQDTALAVGPMMVPPPINGLSFFSEKPYIMECFMYL